MKAKSKKMIALKVSINGKKPIVAGARDLSVLNAGVDAIGILGPKTAPFKPGDCRKDFCLQIGGLTNRGDRSRDVHLRWSNRDQLKIGDVIQIEIVEVIKADRPRSRKKVEKR